MCSWVRQLHGLAQHMVAVPSGVELGLEELGVFGGLEEGGWI